MPEVTFGIETSDVVAFPTEWREALELFIGFSVSAVGYKQYENYKTARYRGFYGYVQFMHGEFVVDTVALEFVNQRLFYNLNTAFGVSDSLACMWKSLQECACEEATPKEVARLRLALTSLRFRLAAGVLGNLVVKYRPVSTACDNIIVSPPETEAQPPDPNNGSYNPGSQPPNTTSDPFDPTGNDGDDPDAPKPELPSSGGRWETVVVFYSPDFPPYTFSAPGNPGDVYEAIGAPPRTDVPGGNCKSRFQGRLNGVQVWITDNCESTAELVVEKRYVPSGG